MLRLTLALATVLLVSIVAAPTAPAQDGLYKKAMDNAQRGFQASGNWKTSSWNNQKVGRNYNYARPGRRADNAVFKMRVPRTTMYKVYARWPASRGYNSSTIMGVRTTSGVRWQRVNQRRQGDRWVSLGKFKLPAGYRQRVIISRARGNGYVIADAIAIVETRRRARSPGGSNGTSRRAVHRHARTWLGVPYRYGGTTRSGVDCSGYTMRVFGKFGVSLPRTTTAQFGRGQRTGSPRVGDLVFSRYSNSGRIEHVGIYAGRGRMINAPYPGTVVRYDTVYRRYLIGYRDVLS